MDFIREITYQVVLQFAPHNGEIYDQRTVYTLLEVPEALKALLAYYNDSHVEILQYRSLPFLKEEITNHQ